MYVGIDIGTGSLKAVLGLKSGIYTITETYMAEMFTPGHHKVEYFRQSLIIFFRNISKYAHSLGEHIDGIGFCGHGPSILLVGDNGSGYARALVAGDTFFGFADENTDNSAGSAGDIRVRCRQKGRIQLTVPSVAITSVGVAVYASDDGTFTLTVGSNTKIGVVSRFVEANTCIVEFDTFKI